MWIGASRNCKREVLGLKWPKHPIKSLGVYLTYDYDKFIKLNYKQHLKTLREPNIYKPHGFFWASSPLLFAFVLLFCFILLLFVFCGK